MADCTAWVLSLGDGLRVAVGRLELVHVIPNSPAMFEIPTSPPACRQVLVWQQNVIPVMDLRTRLGCADAPSRCSTEEAAYLVGIVAYRPGAETAASHGGLLMRDVPEDVRVANEQECVLPEHPREWASLAISCFDDETHGPVPILDVAGLFSRAPEISDTDYDSVKLGCAEGY